MPNLISDGLRARQLFVDRDELIAEFLDRIHDEAPPDDLLFLHGEGGIGKSLLLNHLEDHYCRRLEPSRWGAFVNHSPRQKVEQFGRHEAGQYEQLPHVRVDFGSIAFGENPQNPFFGLAAIRRGLKLPTPLFHAASVLALSKDNRLTKDWIGRLFPGAGAELSAALLDQLNVGGETLLALQTFAGLASNAEPSTIMLGAIAKGLWSVGAQIAGPSLATWLATRKAKSSALEDIPLMKMEELLAELPQLLADDLRTSLEVGGPKRLVLLFDGYDNFRSSGMSDEWLRKLMVGLDLAARSGVVAAVTGQTPPDWGARIPVSLRPVPYLPGSDTNRFLEMAGIEDARLRAAIAEYAAVEDKSVQPLFLALLVDANNFTSGGLDPTTFHANATVEEKQKDILDRLLSAAGGDLRLAAEAMSACRSFDRDVFFGIGKILQYGPTEHMFQTLTKLSFVRPDAERIGWFRCHALMQRFLGLNKAALAVHEAALRWFRMDPASVAEAVYHEYFVDAKGALRRWEEAFQAAVRESKHDVTVALLQVRAALGTGDPRFMEFFADQIGDYLTRASRFDEAEAEFQRSKDNWTQVNPGANLAAIFNKRGNLLQRWAGLSVRRGDREGAEKKFEEADAAYREALSVDPGLMEAKVNRAGSLSRWADLRSRRGGMAAAEEKYREAERVFSELFSNTYESAEAYSNYGAMQSGWGDLQTRVGEYDAAEVRYGAAVPLFDQALQIRQKDHDALLNKGIALAKWAEVRSRRHDFDGAIGKFTEADATFSLLIEFAPEHFEAYNNRGSALRGWGEALSLRQHLEEPQRKFAQAVAAFDDALRLAPTFIEALSNKAGVLTRWAELLVLQGRHPAAEERYAAAVQACETALVIAPRYLSGRNNMGLSLAGWAACLAASGNKEGAEAKYIAAANVYDEALADAPGLIEAHASKGASLARLAELLGQRGEFDGAESAFEAASLSCRRAVELAPSYLAAYNNKGNALRGWAGTKAKRGDRAGAKSKLLESTQTFLEGNSVRKNPDSLHGLAVNALLAAVAAERAEACQLVAQATSLIGDWRETFPWDETRIVQLEGQVRDLSTRLGCTDGQAWGG